MLTYKAISPERPALVRDVKEILERRVTETLKGAECPDHHLRPRVIYSGSATNPRYEIEWCCQKLRDEAAKVLK